MKEDRNTIMYEQKSTKYVIIGCVYYVFLFSALCVGNYLCYVHNASTILFVVIQPFMACIAVAFSYRLEEKVALFGITEANLKSDCIISLIIFVLGIIIKEPLI